MYGVHCVAFEWDDHINQIVKKLSSGSFAIRTIKRYLSVDNLKPLYYSLIHSHRTYVTMLWGSAYQYRLHKLEKLQKSIRKMCNAGYNALFKQLSVSKIMDTYNIQFCKLMYSYITGALLNSLQTIFINNSLVHSHHTRHSQDPHIITRKKEHCHKNLYSPMPKGLASFVRRHEKLQISQQMSKIILPT